MIHGLKNHKMTHTKMLFFFQNKHASDSNNRCKNNQALGVVVVSRDEFFQVSFFHFYFEEKIDSKRFPFLFIANVRSEKCVMASKHVQWNIAQINKKTNSPNDGLIPYIRRSNERKFGV